MDVTPLVEELHTTGTATVPGFLDPATAAEVADGVWRLLARRGIRRDDRSTWPPGRVTRLQALRQARVHAPFLDARLDALADAVLGPGTWTHQGAPQALVTLPQPGPWRVPSGEWHLDVPGRGPARPPGALRVLGVVEPLPHRGGATLAVAGSHELVHRLAAAADGDAGRSADVRRRLAGRHRWFRELLGADGGGDRSRFLEPVVLDDVTVRVVELVGGPGDLHLLHPWTLHAASPNTGTGVRSMCSHTVLRHDNRYYGGG